MGKGGNATTPVEGRRGKAPRMKRSASMLERLASLQSALAAKEKFQSFKQARLGGGEGRMRARRRGQRSGPAPPREARWGLSPLSQAAPPPPCRT